MIPLSLDTFTCISELSHWTVSGDPRLDEYIVLLFLF